MLTYHSRELPNHLALIFDSIGQIAMIHLRVALFSCFSCVVTPIPRPVLISIRTSQYMSNVSIHKTSVVLHYSTYPCLTIFLIYDPSLMRRATIFVILVDADESTNVCMGPWTRYSSYTIPVKIVSMIDSLWFLTRTVLSRNKVIIQNSASRIRSYRVLHLEVCAALAQYEPFGHSYSTMLCLYISILQKCAHTLVQRCTREEQVVPVAFGRIQRYVVTALGVNRARETEVLMEVVHKFEDITFHRPRDGDVIDQAGKRNKVSTTMESV